MSQEQELLEIIQSGLFPAPSEEITGPDGKVQAVLTKADRYNTGKMQWSLVDFQSLEPMVHVLEFGAKKYARNNWKKGLDTNQICESMLRHVFAYMKGEKKDPESGISHIGHIQCNAMFLAYMENNKNSALMGKPIDLFIPMLDELLAKEFGTSLLKLGSKSRKREKTLVKQVVCWYLRIHHSYTFSAIGTLFSEEHSNVMHSVATVVDLLKQEEPLCTGFVKRFMANEQILNGDKTP